MDKIDSFSAVFQTFDIKILWTMKNWDLDMCEYFM